MVGGARAEGRIEAYEDVARNMLCENVPVELIAALTGLSREKIDELADAQ